MLPALEAKVLQDCIQTLLPDYLVTAWWLKLNVARPIY